MALTATIEMNPSAVVTEQTSTAVLTISNSDVYPVQLKALVPYVKSTGGVNPVMNGGVSVGNVTFGPNSNDTVPASSSLVITFPVTFHAPSTGYLSAGTLTYDVGCTGYSVTGAVFAPTADTIEVDYAVTFPASQQ